MSNPCLCSSYYSFVLQGCNPDLFPYPSIYLTSTVLCGLLTRLHCHAPALTSNLQHENESSLENLHQDTLNDQISVSPLLARAIGKFLSSAQQTRADPRELISEIRLQNPFSSDTRKCLSIMQQFSSGPEKCTQDVFDRNQPTNPNTWTEQLMRHMKNEQERSLFDACFGNRDRIVVTRGHHATKSANPYVKPDRWRFDRYAFGPSGKLIANFMMDCNGFSIFRLCKARYPQIDCPKEFVFPAPIQGQGWLDTRIPA